MIQMLNFFILVVMLGILVSLGAGLFFLVRDRGKTRRTVISLSIRVGLAGLLALCNDSETAQRLKLDEHARVLVFGTEGDTDAELYTRIVGESADQVRARQ